MLNTNLLIFQSLISVILKFFAISYQTTTTALSLNAHNILICLSKILIMPTLLNASGRIKKIIVLSMLILASQFYTFTILSAIVVNAVFVNILSNDNSLKDQYIYNLLYRIGAIVGISLISLSAFIPITLGVVYKNIIFCSLILVLYNLFLKKEMDKLDDVKEKPKRSILDLYKNAYKYSDIVSVYLILTVLGFIQSNIAFLSGNHYKALIPCLALIILNFKNTKIYTPLRIIGAIMSHVIAYGLPLFILSFINYKLNTEVKVFAKEKYGDAFEPHITSHLVCDTIWFFIHFGAVLYYLA